MRPIWLIICSVWMPSSMVSRERGSGTSWMPLRAASAACRRGGQAGGRRSVREKVRKGGEGGWRAREVCVHSLGGGKSGEAFRRGYPPEPAQRYLKSALPQQPQAQPLTSMASWGLREASTILATGEK